MVNHPAIVEDYSSVGGGILRDHRGNRLSYRRATLGEALVSVPKAESIAMPEGFVKWRVEAKYQRG